jgi:hypothetical protein
MKKKHKKIMVIGLMSIGVTCFVLYLTLFHYYMGISPQRPSMEYGQLYPLNNHGYIFYVTKNQALWQDILWYTFFVFALGGGLLEVKWKTIQNIGDWLPKKLN